LEKEEEKISKHIKSKFDDLKKERLGFLEDWNSLRKKNEEFIRKIHLDQRALDEKKQLEKLIDLNNPNENAINKDSLINTKNDEINKIKEKELDNINLINTKEKKLEDSDILEENSSMNVNKLEEHIKPLRDEILKLTNTWESKLNKV